MFNKKSRNIIKAEVIKEMGKLSMKLQEQRLFLANLLDGKIKVKRSDYKNTQWYYAAEDKETGLRHYAFRKKVGGL